MVESSRIFSRSARIDAPARTICVNKSCGKARHKVTSLVRAFWTSDVVADFAEPLARKGASVVGLDASHEARLRKPMQRKAVLIDYKQGTAEDLAKTGARFDVITAFEIVEHVANLSSFYAGTSTLLKPNGLLIVATMKWTKRSFLLSSWLNMCSDVGARRDP